MLDVCGLSKDVLLLVKEHLQDLRFTLRRASINGESDIGDKITAYICYRKKLKKETVKCLNCLKRMKSKTMISDLAITEQNLMLVADVLRVRMTSTCIVESLVPLVSRPWLDHKSGKKSAASKLVGVSGRTMTMDDIYDVVVLQSANKRLEGVRIAIEHLELEFECMFRRLIHTRVLLLSILTLQQA
ncbi:hypothetical protein L6164_024927 [Bauhinia variegata]|uniref:Uncharacterized protein n=1 Tax=Bauhinia variegata TaxID=167791 RepID=A0ACB9LZD3_BAUVA|nr:hypothetical protein L6164_024927 [Bauhinia variegata]